MEFPEDRAAATIDLLEARLRRLEYVIKGHLDAPMADSSSKSALERLASLDFQLQKLCSQSRVVREMIQLHANYPEIFEDVAYRDSSSSDVSAMLSVVLASASSYHLVASQLSSILDAPISSAEASRQLIDLEPRIAKLETVQQSQKDEIASLRQRTAEFLQRYYTVDILCTGEYWAELDGRVENIEQQIRRREYQNDIAADPIR